MNVLVIDFSACEGFGSAGRAAYLEIEGVAYRPSGFGETDEEAVCEALCDYYENEVGMAFDDAYGRAFDQFADVLKSARICRAEGCPVNKEA